MSAQVDVKPGLDIETRLFIGGEFVDAVEGGRIPVINPHDNSVITEISEARPIGDRRRAEISTCSILRAHFKASFQTSRSGRGTVLISRSRSRFSPMTNRSDLQANSRRTNRAPPVRFSLRSWIWIVLRWVDQRENFVSSIAIQRSRATSP